MINELLDILDNHPASRRRLHDRVRLELFRKARAARPDLSDDMIREALNAPKMREQIDKKTEEIFAQMQKFCQAINENIVRSN